MRDLVADELNLVAGADGPPHTDDPAVMEEYVEGLMGGNWSCVNRGSGSWSCTRDTTAPQQLTTS